MDELGVYEVLINGIPHTLQLSEEDARARGLIGEQPVPQVVHEDAPKPKKSRSRKVARVTK